MNFVVVAFDMVIIIQQVLLQQTLCLISYNTYTNTSIVSLIILFFMCFFIFLLHDYNQSLL